MTPKTKKLSIQEKKAIDFLASQYTKGTVTEEIADHLKISNRSVGRIMASLIRQDKVLRYGRGTIMIKHSPCSPTAPMGISNSYYELI